MRKLLGKVRHSLANYESVLPYSLLGIIGGIASALAVLAFELAIVELGALWRVENGAEGFEVLPPWLLFSLPAGGAVALGLAYAALRPDDRETGIVHVLSRMHSHYSVLPLRNALVQFCGGAFALASGQSGGREGPGVHLGGAANSLLGQWLGLPNNSLRVLIACGTAGGIAAAFHTPLAGVIFAMEVIVAEYTVAGFLPVMLAAVSATTVSKALIADSVLFRLPPLELNSLLELPMIMLLGFICGIAVAAFIRLSALLARLVHWPIAVRFALAGGLTGGLALAVPQILGIGYDTLEGVLNGEFALLALLTIGACKLLASAISYGVGMPIGFIGPNLLTGACLGGVFGILGHTLQPDIASDPTLYIVVGMGASMGAVLGAPLAAILAVIEMSQNVGISMAAMLAIVTASLTNNGLFRQRSAHETVLRQLRRTVPNDPVSLLLHRSNVTSHMDTRVVRVPITLDSDDLEPLLETPPTWCVVSRGDEDLYLVDGTELLEWLSHEPLEKRAADLNESGIRRWTIATVPVQATLHQALDTLRAQTSEALCVYERSRGSGRRILQGVITRDAIERYTLSSLG